MSGKAEAQESAAESAKAVYRTMKILEHLAMGEGVGVNEISRSLGLHKSTVFRFLNSLKNLHYVQQDPVTELYHATIKVFELGAGALRQIDFVEFAKPVLEGLAAETDETIHLAVLEDGKLVYLHKIESTQSLRVFMKSRVGHTAPLHCTGLGKCLLAFAHPELACELSADGLLSGFTAKTHTSLQALDKDLTRIRERGYAIDDEEHEPGVSCVAVPVYGADGAVVAAISLSMPTARVTPEVLSSHAATLRTAAARVHACLRDRPPQEQQILPEPL